MFVCPILSLVIAVWSFLISKSGVFSNVDSLISWSLEMDSRDHISFHLFRSTLNIAFLCSCFKMWISLVTLVPWRAAFFAALSALSFPYIPWWDGIQISETSLPRCCICSIFNWIVCMIGLVQSAFGSTSRVDFESVRMAAWVSTVIDIN